ncbi:MAG: RidA family protein [Bacteroidota bacterium]|nr:RidA family protein [Bacteroidota bacterium]
MKHTIFYGFAIVAIGFLLYLNFRPRQEKFDSAGLINTQLAPLPIGPYSQAIRKGNCFFLSGQVGIDPRTGNIDSTDIATETKLAMQNVKAILETSHLKMNDIASTTIYLTDLNDFKTVNETYAKFFGEGPYPARSTVQVAALPKGAHIEISVIAVKE